MSQNSSKKIAIIAGAGPAGLTAAYELVHRSDDVQPIIFEASGAIGGISKTVNYKGNRIDIGGHRFFSKSDRVMKWWTNILPIQGAPAKDALLLQIKYHNRTQQIELQADGPDPEKVDRTMLIRNRLSRIFYLRRFFDYPISLNLQTVKNLGLVRIVRIGFSYTLARVRPIKPERSLEDFFINRFGRELYLTFFKDYTEKVWGIPCNKISAEWGAQRIKGLSITKALVHAAKSVVPHKSAGIDQKKVETSLIEHFLYPKYGPGQMWEEVARIVESKGTKIHMHHVVVAVINDGDQVKAVKVKDLKTGKVTTHPCDYFFSTMPVKELVEQFETPAPANVREVAAGLMYRDFITVGLLLNKLEIKNETATPTLGDIVPDNWIYIQERDVKIGRLQIFNNWSPYMVEDPSKVWIGLEYFCNEGDELWVKPDQEFIDFAIAELAKIDIINPDEVIDSTILRVKKTYPAYFGTYERFDEIKDYVGQYQNLFLVGRNGMHKYNNQDHSMLTAMTAVDNILAGVTSKDNLWSVNTEMEYHEDKEEEQLQRTGKASEEQREA